jgi:diketogulonate reductase-like aldo/keto reductase
MTKLDPTIPIKLSSGTAIPPIGFGTWRMKDHDEAVNAVSAALASGYRHIDTAQIYRNEQFVGEAVASSGIPRDQVFITTKIWSGNLAVGDLPQSFDESLETLRTDYVDLLLMHWPITGLRGPAWHEMERLHDEGRAKAIGVSNFTVRHLKELLAEAKVKPAVNQIELHVFLQQPELVRFCQDHDIVVEAYSPLVHGERLDAPTISEIAKKHGKSATQIMLRWTVEVGAVPLPKSTHPDHIKANLDIFDFALDADDMAKIKTLDDNFRTCDDPNKIL